MKDRVIAYYDREAHRLFDVYRSFSFEEIHREIIPFLPDPPCKVLDVGAGAGRDAIALAELGYDVLAIEPSSSLRKSAQLSQPSKKLIWCNDNLPRLSSIKQGSYFSFILCSAVWMHLTFKEQQSAMRRLADLCLPGGKICISFRTKQAKEPTSFYETLPNRVIADAKNFRFSLLKQTKSIDLQSRGEVIWYSLIFEARKF